MSLKDKLIANEEIVFEAEKHWVSPIRESIKPALLLIAAVIVSRISPDDATGIMSPVETVLGWLTIGLVVAGIAWIAYNLVVWRTAAFAITNLRVMREEGLISRRSSATMLQSVTDVQTRVPFLGSKLGFGDVLVATQSGDSGTDRFRSITQPEAFRNEILNRKMEDRGSVGQSPASSAAPAPAPAAAVASSAEDMATLERLAALRDAGTISGEEFEAKKAEILSRI